MAELAEKLLLTLSQSEQFDTLDLSSQLNIEHEKLVGAVKSLQSKGDVRAILWCFLLKPVHMFYRLADDVIIVRLDGTIISVQNNGAHSAALVA